MSNSNPEQKVNSWVVYILLVLMLACTVWVCRNIVEIYKRVNNAEKYNKESVGDFIRTYEKVDLTDSLHPSSQFVIPKAEVDSFLSDKTGIGSNQKMTYDRDLLLLVALCGALGSFIYILSSFTNFFGNRKLENSWLPWYLAKPFIGSGLAIVGLFILRAGFLSANVSTTELNLYGILGLSCMMGLFSDDATLKLKDIFEAIFRPKDTRQGKMEENNVNNNASNSSVPTAGIEILELSPKEIEGSASESEIKLIGHNLPKDSHIKLNMEVLPEDLMLERDENLIRFKLPKMPDNTREIKVAVYDPNTNQEIDAGTLRVK